METTIVCCGYIGIMENKMETTILPEDERVKVIQFFGLTSTVLTMGRKYDQAGVKCPTLGAQCSNL